MNQHFLAQINVGRLCAEPGDSQLAGFFDNLDRINQLAEESPGFIWRLQSEQGNATDIILTDDPLFIINMSVWTSVESLRAFAYQTEHLAFIKRRLEWFERHEGIYQALWWVPAGEMPTPEEGLERLALLATEGPTVKAFTFKHAFASPSLHDI